MTEIEGHRNELFHVIEAGHVQHRYEGGDPVLDGEDPEAVALEFREHVQAHRDIADTELFAKINANLAYAVGLLAHYETRTNRPLSLRVDELGRHLSRCEQIAASLCDDLPNPKKSNT